MKVRVAQSSGPALATKRNANPENGHETGAPTRARNART
jgi:hypothetical protein